MNGIVNRCYLNFIFHKDIFCLFGAIWKKIVIKKKSVMEI